jgi:hypothetical protein
MIQICDRLEPVDSLPALRDVTIHGVASNAVIFFEKHGAKIRELRLDSCVAVPVFDMCPAMSFFRVSSLVSMQSFDFAAS